MGLLLQCYGDNLILMVCLLVKGFFIIQNLGFQILFGFLFIIWEFDGYDVVDRVF